MAKTFNAGDVLPASDLNTNMVQPGTAGTGVRVVSGTTSLVFSGSVNAVSVTVSYGYTFSAAPKLTLTAQTGSNVDLVCTMQGAPGVSSASVRAAEKGGNNVGAATYTLHWIAIGPP